MMCFVGRKTKRMPRFNKADLRHIEDLFIDHDYLVDEEKDEENNNENQQCETQNGVDTR